MTTIRFPEIATVTTLTDAIITPMPRRIAAGGARPATFSSTLGSIFRLIAEAIESASEARCRYPSAD